MSQLSFLEGGVDTLARSREELTRSLEAGTHCPCCGQYAKIYKRKLNSGMAMSLVALYRGFRESDEWVHVLDYLVGIQRFNADFPKLRHWGLLEACPIEREDGSDRNGFYRLTGYGRRFARGEVSVPRYARLYNDGLLGLTGPELNIRQALGSKFSFDELMGGG